ncbi:GNAT family N-acetyltransferase [Rothia sp. P7181]|uniref:GNAT family N-acetyltransferase n=1 Tax=Rothia sp. P7181 TaxID=3402663 RepID=UPI003AE29FE6
MIESLNKADRQAVAQLISDKYHHFVRRPSSTPEEQQRAIHLIIRRFNPEQSFSVRRNGKIVGFAVVETSEYPHALAIPYASIRKEFSYFKSLLFWIALRIYRSRKIEIDEYTARVEILLVDRNHRRQGVATELLEKIQEFAHEEGKTSLTLEVPEDDIEAHTFFNKVGFTTLSYRQLTQFFHRLVLPTAPTKTFQLCYPLDDSEE